MQNFKTMSNIIFESQFKEVVGRERRVTVEVLHHFREAERRMLYAERGRQSLREYAIKDLKYSEPAADRRIAAMRAVKDMPEIEEKIANGDLSLSTINQARVSIRLNEQASGRRATSEEKKEILESIEGLSFNQTKKVLADACPAAHPEIQEKVQPSANATYKLETTLTDDLYAMLNEIQDLLGRRVEIRELLREMACEKLTTLRKKRGVATAGTSINDGAPASAQVVPSVDTVAESKGVLSKRSKGGTEPAVQADKISPLAARAKAAAQGFHPDQVTASNHSINAISSNLEQCVKEPETSTTETRLTECAIDIDRPGDEGLHIVTPGPSQTPTKRRNYISVKMDRAVRARSGHQCEYVDPETGVRCSAKRHLELEHILPISHGGDDSVENLQVYCATHNKLKAAHQLGFDFMADFVPSLH